MREIRVASGGAGGFYDKYVSRLQDLGAQGHPRIVNQPSRGAWDNLVRLESGNVDLGLTQLDTLIEFLRQNPDSGITAAQVVFYDFLHILVRRPLTVSTISDFAGLRIWLGASKSGTERTGERFLDMSGLSPHRYDRIPENDLEQVKKLFQLRELDVALFVGATETPFIKDLVASGTCSLFNINANAARAFLFGPDGRSSNAQIFLGSIPAGLYSPSQKRTQALMVPVVLVVGPATSEEDAGLVLRWVDEVRADPELNPSLSMRPVESVNLVKAGVPTHLLYDPPTSSIDWFNVALVGGPLVLLSWLVYRYWLGVLRLFRNHLAVFASLAATIIIAACAYGSYLAEHRINGNFSNVLEAQWSIVFYMLSGLENRAPLTVAGRVFATISLLMGPVLLALFTGLFASALIMRALEKRMSSNLSDHIIVLNWGEKAKQIVTELRAPGLQSNVIAVLTDDPSVNFKALQTEMRQFRDRRALRDLFFSAGDPTDEAALLNVNVQKSKAVIITACEAVTDDADGRTIRSIVMLKKIAQRQDIELHIVAEFVKLENVQVATELAEDFPGTLEAVGLGEVLTLMLASASMNLGLVGIYKDLLSVTPDSNEIYSVRIPDSAAGMRFRDYAARVIRDVAGESVIPIGLRRRVNGRFTTALNPAALLPNGGENPYARLLPGDELFVIAFNQPAPKEMPTGIRSRSVSKRARPKRPSLHADA